MMKFIKRFTYKRKLRALIRSMHLSNVFRTLYYYLFRPLGGILTLQVGGMMPQFYIRTPGELRILESMGGGGCGEQHILGLLISNLHSGDVVYDIGAHVGLYTVPLAKAVGPQGQVIAFEPEIKNFEHLKENVDLNGLKNVHTFRKALGDQDGEKRLYLGEDTGNSSLVQQHHEEEKYELVEIVKGDQFVEGENLSIPKVVKIDVEGYEYNVIMSLRKTLMHPDCELVCCEIHPQLLPREVKPKMILSFLKSLGFSHIDFYEREMEYHAVCYKNEKKMNVLLCAYACLRDPDQRFGNGGEGVLGWNILKQLNRFYNLSILTSSQNKKSIEEALRGEPLLNANFYYLDLPRSFKFLNSFSGGVQIYAYLWQIMAQFSAQKLHREFHFDVFHHVTYANDWMASFIGALLPIPYIRGPGGGALHVPKNFLSDFSFIERIGQYLRAIGQWLFRHDPFFIIGQNRARAILVCNRESFEAIPKKWQQKTYLFPVNGISKEDLDLLSKTEKKDNNRLKVLLAGKLLSIKGFNLAIKAFKIFLGKVSNAELQIIGDGPEFARLKNLSQKLGIQKKVQFKKWLPRNEFLRELALCDVFLFPSLRDGGGQVVVEAMAAGKPVICLDIGGPGFHINDEWGIKIPPHSPKQAIQEMAKALEILYLDKELRLKLGKAARERVERMYHWDRLGKNLLKIYQEVLKI